MRMYDLIVKKRNGEALSKEEIEYFVKEYTNGNIPDYQVSALLMVIYFNSLSYEETLNLTLAMAHSGDLLNLSKINGIKVDKHSTGGIGDKTSLIVGPMVASIGAKMAKMSGRGLGFTGGTIDKLESIPGFSTSLSEEQFIDNVNKIGMAITGQTGNLDPADKKLYALRDVTATVDISALIASSIMSKKLAAGADVIVLDVKTGSGAFMKKEADAFKLADMMVKIGNGAGRKTVAIISDMDEPLGNCIGNALEVKEAIEALNGQGASDLMELCIVLASYMIWEAGITSTLEEAKIKLQELINNKSALNKLAEFIKAQGGNSSVVYNTELLPKASIIYELKATNTGYIKHIQSDKLGNALVILGGGREVKGEAIDHSVGIVLNKKVGDFVNEGDTIAFIHANDNDKLKVAIKRVTNAYEYSDTVVSCNKLIKGIIS